MRVENTPVGQSMVHYLKQQGYQPLNFNAFFLPTQDGSGAKYIKIAKVVQDVNSGSVQMNIIPLRGEDITKIVQAVFNKAEEEIEE